MGRSPCCSKEGLNRGAWTAMEDKILTDYIQIYGEGKWRNLPKRAGLKRCGKSCRLRWLNYLRPDIKRGNISRDEEELIIRLHNLLGNRWSLIAGRLPGRTDNEIKNYWNTNIGKKIQGNPNSTTCRKTSNNEKAKTPSPTARHSAIQPSKVTNPITSHVVRTKASRCTKAVLFPHHAPKLGQIDDHDDTATKPAAPIPPPCVDIDQVNGDQMVVDLQPSLLPLSSDEINSSEFMMDFELGENFLSDFPNNVDFLHLTYNLGNGGEDNNDTDIATSSEFEKGQSSSPKSDHHQNLLFSQDHMLYGVDLESMTSIVDPQVLDWLQD